MTLAEIHAACLYILYLAGESCPDCGYTLTEDEGIIL